MVGRPSLTVGTAILLAAAPRADAVAQQAATIVGKVTNPTHIPVASALVSIPRLRISTQTNDAGVYRVFVPGDRLTEADTLRVPDRCCSTCSPRRRRRRTTIESIEVVKGPAAATHWRARWRKRRAFE